MTDLVGRQLGDFEVVRELGRGGMGVVYEARQRSLNRRVALKVLGPGLGLTPRAVDRFRREAEAAAKLHHSNIVPVYATGEEDGVHFYAMELIDGPSLDQVIRGVASGGRPPPDSASHPGADAPRSPALDQTGPYAPPAAPTPPSGSASASGARPSADRFDRAAAMIADVADALHHAHQQGVTHRDVKPSNLLLSSDGRLSVTDFGLARLLEQPGMTVTGEFVGTPAYMSPEQITAGRVPLDHRTDIYSLGATLYELLTLRPPFRAEGRDKLLAMVIQKEPAAPRSIDPKVPRDLETICLKCLEKDPDRRYQSAKDLAEDLRRYVNRFAIKARRAGPLARAGKWVKRNPWAAALLGCLLIALLAAGFFAYQAGQDRGQLRAEERQAAVDKAILEAMSGDAEAALQAVADAENKGAEPGELNLLRGLVEYHRGRLKEALVYLEQADQQMPGSVAVKALRAIAYLDSGRLERYDEMYAILDQLEPKTPEDRLFLSLFLTEVDPHRSLRILDEAPAPFRQAPVARLVRGIVQWYLAQDTGKAEDAEQALDDLGKVDLPDNPLWLSSRLKADLTAAHAYAPGEPRRRQIENQAARDVEALATHTDNALAFQARCYYLLVRGDADALIATARQARESRIEDAFVTYMEVSALYTRKDDAEALRVLQSAKDTGDESAGATEREIVLAAMSGRKDEAEKAITDVIRSRSGGTPLSYVCAYLQLLGPEYRAKTRQAAQDIREHSSRLIPGWRHDWYHVLLDFHAGRIDDRELLRTAGESRFNQCEANFYIGLEKLGEGDRKEAGTYFQSAVNTNVFYYYEYIWGRAFLARIDDPNWLPWAGGKK